MNITSKKPKKMLKHIKISLFLLLMVFLSSCQGTKNTMDEQSLSAIQHDSQTNSSGLSIKGKKEGVWIYALDRNIYEYKCYSDGNLDNVSLRFLKKENKMLPLGMTVNNLKVGMWFNYDNATDSVSIFNLDKELSKKNLQYKVLFSGKKALENWINDSNKINGLKLTYSDSVMLFSSSFLNDTMSGVFISNPQKSDSTYVCTCTKNGYLNGYSVEYYLDGKIASFGRFIEGKRVEIWEYFSKKGEITKKIDYNGKAPKIIYGADSNTFLPPLPPPTTLKINRRK